MMNGVQLINLLNLNTGGLTNKSNPYGLYSDGVFESILESRIFTEKDKKAAKIERQLKARLKKSSGDTVKTRVDIDSDLYYKLAEDEELREKVEDTLDYYLSKENTLPMGMEAALTIDSEGKASYKQQYAFPDTAPLGNKGAESLKQPQSTQTDGGSVFSPKESFKRNQQLYWDTRNRMKGLKN